MADLVILVWIVSHGLVKQVKLLLNSFANT